MRTLRSALGCCLVLAACWTAPCLGAAPGEPASSARETGGQERGAVRWREILTESGVTRIRLEAPPQTAYEIAATETPPVVEIDLREVALAGFPTQVKVGDGLIEAVETATLSEGTRRIRVRLLKPARAEVVPWQGGLDVLIRPIGPAATQARGGVVEKLASGDGLSFSFGRTPAKVSAFALSDGKRLVIDAEGVTIPDPQIVEEYAEGPIARVRIARQEARVRAVVEVRAPEALEGYRVEKTARGVDLALGRSSGRALPEPEKAQTAQKPTGESPKTAPTKQQVAPFPADAKGGGDVVDLGFRQEGPASLVEVVLSKPARHEVREASGKRVVLDVLGTALSPKFRRALDTSAFPGPVTMVAAYARKRNGTTDTRLVVDLKRPVALRVEERGDRLALIFEGGKPAEASAVPGVMDVRRNGAEVVVVEGKPVREKPGMAEEAQNQPTNGASGKDPGATGSPYTGRRLSLDFVDADIRNVLRIIGEVSGLNVVAGEDVQGKVTVRLVDLPWDQALAVILKTRGLDQVREANVIRIAPSEKLAQEKTRARDAEKGAEEKAPLASDIIDVNYASAQELSDKVKAILTPRGSLAIDQRTNAILIKDLPAKIQEARALVARLDTPTPQVVIEARIVEVASTFTRDLGVQWGGRYRADTAHGNSTDWAFPNSIGVSGATGTANYAVNFPAAIGPGAGSALAFSLGHINDVLSLDLRLSALESSGQGRVVSSPRVATLDNRTAEISQGVSIPFTTTTQEKIETKSIDYLLKLNVTPHVTADGAVMMKIDVRKDAPSSTFRAVDDKTPAKETRSATTEVLVKDGETTVIGGIITDTQGTSVRGVPFLSKVPVLGWLFKGKTDDTTKTELIIFITPKISTPTAIARNP